MTTRRAFLGAVAGAAAHALGPRLTHGVPRPLKALAVDGFVVFDPRPIAALAESMVPGRAADLVAAWRTRQFEYTWLRTIMRRYADFWTVTEEALVFAAHVTGVDLDASQRARLMEGYLRLGAYPDVRPVLTAARAGGLRVAFLTNLSPRMLDAATDGAGLGDLFDHRLSTNSVATYKPDPRAYQLAIDALGLEVAEIGFVASAGWDAAGAKAFGYPTFWVNRARQAVEELGLRPDVIGAALTDLPTFLRRSG